MKHWNIENDQEITLIGDNVLRIMKEDDGRIKFEEELDNWNSVTMSKEEAKAALLEAIAWIDKQ